MRITIAKRVYGGFSIIIFLLLVISSSSLISLSDIDGSTQQVDQVAIPILDSGANIREAALVIEGTVKDIKIANTLESLSNSQSTFQQYVDLFSVNLNELRKASSTHEKITADSLIVKNEFEGIVSNIEKLFALEEQVINLTRALNEQHTAMAEQADNVSIYILDFADLELDGGNFERALRQADKVETMALKIIEFLAKLKQIQSLSLEEAVNLKGEVEFALGRLEGDVQYIIDEMAGIETDGILEEMQVETRNMQEQGLAEDGFVANTIAALENISKVQALSSQVLQQMETVKTQLRSIQDDARQLSNEIQGSVSSSVTRGTVMTIVVFLLSVVFAITIALYSARSIVGPLNRVKDMLQVVSDGDLTKHVDYSAKDELGDLSNSCNSLIDNLRDLIHSIMSRASQLTSASEQTSGITEKSSAAIQQQKSQVAQVSDATEQMSDFSETVVSSAEEALKAIQEADDEAEKVKNLSLSNRDKMLALADEVEAASSVINKLDQDSTEIGTILDVIRGVAEQTNLLALNAAIEAARAGEQGRGFAVVADEVRTLASRTQQSTEEINAMIAKLQSGSREAVAVMEKGRQQAKDCVEQVETATSAVQHITSAVHVAFDRSSQIVESANQQNRVAHDISDRLDEVVTIAEQAAQGAQKTAQSSTEVARLAEELELSVQEFKV
jgi:methyl-accepting chemotaxis protein